MLNAYTRGIEYAQKVVSRDILTGKWVRLACERFISDLEDDSFEYTFDTDKAQHICSFFEIVIKHTKGKLAGKPYELSNWETFLLINLYGWVKRSDHTIRRFRNGIAQVARKNSKSTLAAGLPIYDMYYGDEGVEVYSVATMRDQAKIVWDNTGRMIEKAPASLRGKFKHTVSEIKYAENFSTFKPLGRDSKNYDGLNPTLVIHDEAAAITDRNVMEVMSSATGSRENYLMLYITTAQPNKETIYYEKQQYVKSILSGDIDDPRWFGFICEPDEGDDWKSDEAIIKANPNLGRSISMEYLQEQRSQAEHSPSARANYQIKHLNMFISTSAAWLPEEDWQANIIPKLDTSGDLWVGIDLGATSDLTSLGFLYRNEGAYHFDYKCFIPESAFADAPKYVKPLYRSAIEAGTLILTPGNATDYNIVKDYLKDYTSDKNLKEIAYDPWSAQKFATELLEEGSPLVEVNQGMRHLSPATKDTEIHIRKGEIKHLDDRFLQWQFSNCTLYTDVNGNIKVRKGDDNNLKIDSIVALILAVSRASSNGGLNKPKFNFVYANI